MQYIPVWSIHGDLTYCENTCREPLVFAASKMQIWNRSHRKVTHTNLQYRLYSNELSLRWPEFFFLNFYMKVVDKGVLRM